MPVARTVTFQEALEIFESFPEQQQDDFVDILRRRRRERRRAALAESIAEARQEYDRGEVRRGTAEDLLKELSE